MVIDEEVEKRVPDLNPIAMTQGKRLDRSAVHQGFVVTTQILNLEPFSFFSNLTVASGDQVVLDMDPILRIPTD